MTENDDLEIQKDLKKAFPPANTELRRDLWPEVLRRLDQHAAVPWYDWALGGVAFGWFVFFPQLILVFAYHF